MAGAFVRRRQGSASALHARSGPSVKCVTHIPSASTPWLAAKAATAPGAALLLGLPPQSATGTMGNAGELRWIHLLGPVMETGKMPSAYTPVFIISQFSLVQRLHCVHLRAQLPTQNRLYVWSNWSPQVAQKSLGGQMTNHLKPQAALPTHSSIIFSVCHDNEVISFFYCVILWWAPVHLYVGMGSTPSF